METALPPTSRCEPLVILNPAANRGHMARHRALLQQRLTHEHAEYRETSSAGEAQDLAYRAACDGRPIVVVGGDGSVNEVVNGILRSGRRIPLGIVAAGSGNDFATSTLRLPREPEQAIERAFSGQPVSVDAGKVNGIYFVNACSIGLDADIAEAAGKLKKYPLMSGARLYYGAVFRQLFFGYHRCPWLKIRLDEEVFVAEGEKHYVLVAISNGPAYGAGFNINPAAQYDDGLFDICTIDYTSLLNALRWLPILKKGRHAQLPVTTFYRAHHVYVESRVPVNIQVDGETTRATRFEIEMLPGALSIRV